MKFTSFTIIILIINLAILLAIGGVLIYLVYLLIKALRKYIKMCIRDSRIPDHLATIEGILEIIISINNQIGREFACIMMERKFFPTIKDYLYYKINDSICLEEYFELIPKKKVNIVDLSEDEFNGVMELLEKNHFGNLQFKRRLKEELRKYRLFNKTGDVYKRQVYNEYRIWKISY